MTIPEDRYVDGYKAARTYYERRIADTGALAQEWSHPTDPMGERGRDAIRQAWPTLAARLDALTET